MAQSFLQPVDIECETCLDACLSMDSASEIHFRKRRIWIRSALWESSLSFIVRVFLHIVFGTMVLIICFGCMSFLLLLRNSV